MPSMYVHADCYVQHGPLKAKEAQFHEEGECRKLCPVAHGDGSLLKVHVIQSHRVVVDGGGVRVAGVKLSPGLGRPV